MDNLTLRWRIDGPGSATFTLDVAHETVEIRTTYVGDGLGSVLQAACDLQLGSSSAIAYLPAEPGGTCLFFAVDDGIAYLQVVQFSDMQSELRRWSGGSLRWHGDVGIDQFVRQVVQMAEKLLDECGSSAAYSAAWGNTPFPAGKLERLRGSS